MFVSELAAPVSEPADPKIDSIINQAMRSWRFDVAGMSVASSGLQVYIDMHDMSSQALQRLRDMNVTIEIVDASQKLVQGRIPPASLVVLANLPEVRFVRLPDYGMTPTIPEAPITFAMQVPETDPLSMELPTRTPVMASAIPWELLALTALAAGAVLMIFRR